MNQNNIKKQEASVDLIPECELADTRTGRLTRLWSRIKQSDYYYLVYAFAIPFALMYLIYLAMGVHPFGDGSVLVLDLNGQYVSFYEALREFVYGNASLLYSFCRALGGEYMGIVAYYVASPLSYIVALFPKDRILEALLLLFLIKTGLCGASMGFYLHKVSKKVNRTSVVVFSIMYALCSYAVVHQNNNMWIDSLIWLPLLTYGIEQLIKHGKYKLYVVSLAMSLISNYYIGYMMCIYTAAYFMYYYFAHNENFRNNPREEKAHFSKSFIRIAIFSILGIGISMVIVAGAYYSLTFGKDTFSNPNYSLSQQFDILDLLSKFYPCSYDTVRPEGWPFVYCGLLTVILVPCYFLSKRFSLRERTASGIFIGFFLLSFIASTIDIMWHGFQRPNWLNYRYSFMLCFFMLVLAYRAFGDLRRVSKKSIFMSGAFWALILIILQALEYENIHDIETVWFSLLCIGAYVATLIIGKKSYYKNTVSLVMAVIVCLEVFCSGLMNCVDFGNDVIYTKYSSYNNYMDEVRPIIELVQKEDPTFYRWEKTSMRKTNDNLALGIRGLSCSTSTLNKDTIKLLANMGYASKSNWSRYLGGTPVNDSIFGLKYIVAKEDLSEYYEAAFSEGAYTAYYNPYHLSIGFGVSSYVEDFVMIADEEYSEKDPYSNPFDRMNALITAMLGSEELISVFVPLESTAEPTVTNGTAGYIAGHHKYSPDGSSTCTVNYSLTNPTTQQLFFYLPSDYQREVDLKVNSSSKGTFFGNDTYRIIDFGYQREGALDLSVTLKADVLYVKDKVPMVYYIDRPVFEEAIKALQQTQIVLDEDCTDTKLTGSITTNRGYQKVLLTIPYDAGWQVFVDGERVETEEALDSLITFTVKDAGEHRITMRYSPKSFTLGLAVTLVSLIAFILLCIFEKPVLKLICGREEMIPMPVHSEEGDDNADDNDNDADEDDTAASDGCNNDVESVASEENNESDPTEN